MLRTRAERFAQRGSGDRERALELASLSKGEVSLDALAKSLHLSSRTLRRRLDEHGMPYKTLLDEVRRELALHHVARSDEPLDLLAKRLGFSEPSTFYRAFKRWTGHPPAQYRRNQRASD